MAILSSRINEEDIIAETLQTFLYVLREVLGGNTMDLPTCRDELLIELDNQIFDMAAHYDAITVENIAITADMLSAKVRIAMLEGELLKASNLLVAIADPVNDEDLLDNAIDVLIQEGDAAVANNSGVGILTPFSSLSFVDYKLRDGLRLAIESYNNELGSKILTNHP